MLIVDLIMQAMIGSLIYLFWVNYRATKNATALVIAVFWSLAFIYHLVFSIILEDSLKLEVTMPFGSHHILLFTTLIVLNYVLIKELFIGKTIKSKNKLRKEKKRAA